MAAIVPAQDFLPTTPITVVIPARNEAATIADCLNSIKKGSYPSRLLELIVINDHSTDETVEKAIKHGARVLHLADYLTEDNPIHGAFKKTALELGIRESGGSLIVTTDADCLVPTDWLRQTAWVFERERRDTSIMAAPVLLTGKNSFLEQFQRLDFLGMQVISTAGYALGWHHFGNGANLAYRKSDFERVQGYQANKHKASGDDYFLLEAIQRKKPGTAYFLKSPSSAVLTRAESNWKNFLLQRLRWGGKAEALSNANTKLILLLVLLQSLSLIFCTIAGLVAESRLLILSSVGVWALKGGADYRLLKTGADFFESQLPIPLFLLSLLFHPIYITSIGIAGRFIKRVEWKGRKVR